MKAVILAGGMGTRISEETILRPKPMIEIGGKPILWHIMKIYSAHGINDFIICLGYKGYMIKEYFANYFLHMSDVTIDLAQNQVNILNHHSEPWRVTLLDTGEQAGTGGRLKRVGPYLGEEDSCFTYGDGVADIDIQKLVAFHKEQKVLATITAVQPPGRFGALDIDGTRIRRFQEKPLGDGSWINGGFFVLSPKVLAYIEGDEMPWEDLPVQNLVKQRQLGVYQHSGFWMAMDTLRDKKSLETFWSSGQAPSPKSCTRIGRSSVQRSGLIQSRLW